MDGEEVYSSINQLVMSLESIYICWPIINIIGKRVYMLPLITSTGTCRGNQNLLRSRENQLANRALVSRLASSRLMAAIPPSLFYGSSSASSDHNDQLDPALTDATNTALPSPSFHPAPHYLIHFQYQSHYASDMKILQYGTSINYSA